MLWNRCRLSPKCDDDKLHIRRHAVSEAINLSDGHSVDSKILQATWVWWWLEDNFFHRQSAVASPKNSWSLLAWPLFRLSPYNSDLLTCGKFIAIYKIDDNDCQLLTISGVVAQINHIALWLELPLLSRVSEKMLTTSWKRQRLMCQVWSKQM